MNILISGATGFIGRHLVRRLTSDGHAVTALIREATDTGRLAGTGVQTHVAGSDVEELIAFVKHEHFDGVVHLASLFLAQHRPKDVPQLIASNVLFSTVLLEAAATGGAHWFINTGTFWQHYEDADYAPVNLYAATKQSFEDIARYYVATTPLDIVHLKLSDTFGPEDTRPKVINLWLKTAQSGESLDMSPGEQRIDISYIDNVIDAYVQLMDLVSKDEARVLAGKSFAVTSGEVMTLRALADAFQEATGLTLHVNWGKRPYRPREVMVPWTEGERVPGWEPRVSLREGIRRMLDA